MDLLINGLSWFFLISGSVFVVIGGLGLLRLPDFYTRVHAASITDTVGAWLILIGLMFQSPSALVLVKLVLVLIFLVLTSPLASHALTKAAFHRGLEPYVGPGGERRDER
ncbi:MAG: monovalent cation/H(+) antiporter subunit G [bacterium]|nr:monovalent cation/H(+) antiporter subunit G [bacterium]